MWQRIRAIPNTNIIFVQMTLVKVLKPGDIVVMDNLSSHTIAGVREAIERAGAALVYLPPYSPDLNPIEQVMSKFRNEIRKRKLRTKSECDELCGESLDWFPPDECRNCIRHVGYAQQE